MKKKAPFKLIAFYSLLLVVVFSSCKTIIPCPPCPGLCIQCDSTKSLLMSTYNIETMSFQKTKSSHDWIILDITFKQNTDEESRVNAVRPSKKCGSKTPLRLRRTCQCKCKCCRISAFGYFESAAQAVQINRVFHENESQMN
jgi:hypothetical protein